MASFGYIDRPCLTTVTVWGVTASAESVPRGGRELSWNRDVVELDSTAVVPFIEPAPN